MKFMVLLTLSSSRLWVPRKPSSDFDSPLFGLGLINLSTSNLRVRRSSLQSNLSQHILLSSQFLISLSSFYRRCSVANDSAGSTTQFGLLPFPSTPSGRAGVFSSVEYSWVENPFCCWPITPHFQRVKDCDRNEGWEPLILVISCVASKKKRSMAVVVMVVIVGVGAVEEGSWRKYW